MKRQLVWILSLIALPVLAQEEVDAVAEGRQAFATYGCITCHVVDKDDNSLRTGPSLYGLFVNDARDREIIVPGSGEKKKVKADPGSSGTESDNSNPYDGRGMPIPDAETDPDYDPKDPNNF